MLDTPQRRPERNLDGLAPCPPDHGRITVVGRGEDEHFVARLDGRENGGTERLRRAARDADILAREMLTEVPVVMRGDGVAERRQSTRWCILVRAFPHRARGRFKDLIR